MTAKSNLLLIQRAFSDIIIERIDKDLNGRSSSMSQQTATEPFHIHVPDKHGLVKEKRLPNEKHRDLMSIMELIRIQIIK